MIQINITGDDREDIVDSARLLAVLDEIVEALNDLDSRLQQLETS
jgi:hypothetical protein